MISYFLSGSVCACDAVERPALGDVLQHPVVKFRFQQELQSGYAAKADVYVFQMFSHTADTA